MDERGPHKFTIFPFLGSVAKVYTVCIILMNAYANYNAANVSQPRLFSPATIYEMEHFRHGSMGNHLPLAVKTRSLLEKYPRYIVRRPSIRSIVSQFKPGQIIVALARMKFHRFGNIESASLP